MDHGEDFERLWAGLAHELFHVQQLIVVIVWTVPEKQGTQLGKCVSS